MEKVPLDDQVKNLLLRVHLTHFSGLIDLLPKKFNHDSILKSVRKFACLVNGVWVVKSTILFEGLDKANDSALDLKRMICARDYLVIQFFTPIVRYDYCFLIGF